MLGSILICAAILGMARAQETVPKLPRLDWGACPFACCQLGKWTATKNVTVFSDWKKGRRAVGHTGRGEVVTAITGVNITFEPGRIRVLKSFPEYGIKRGDVLPTYTYRGEGYIDFWWKGKMHSDQIENKECGREDVDEPTCTLSHGKKEWWVRIKRANGTSGWVFGNKGFDGTDACG